MFQIVVDAHQFLGAGRYRIRQQTGLVAPDNGLRPGVHGPDIVAVPHIVHTQGLGLIGKDAGGMGIEVGHHRFDRRIRDRFGIAPCVALQRPPHPFALFSAEAHRTFSVEAKVHLVHITLAQSRGFILGSAVSTVIHLDGILCGGESCAGEQAQHADQGQQSRDQAGSGEMELFHSLSASFFGKKNGPPSGRPFPVYFRLRIEIDAVGDSDEHIAVGDAVVLGYAHADAVAS